MRTSDRLLLSPESPTTQLRNIVERAVEFARRHQQPNGSWRVPPEPRILENALVVYVLRRLQLAERPMAEALAWLLKCPSIAPSPADAGSLVGGVEHWLREAAVRGCASPQVALLSGFEHPQATRRLRLLRALEAEAGLSAEGALIRLREELMTSLVSVGEAKPWSAAEDASLYLIVEGPGAESTDVALRLVQRALASDGSVANNPISTVLALWAATRVGATNVASQLLDALLRLRVDGTWRFCTTEVWDTALLTRSLLLAGVGSDAVHAARGFLRETQNADGGWGYACGRDSDVDTSAMSSLVMERGSTTFERAQRYLLGRRDSDGLWRTWHDKLDSVAVDVIAHAVVALSHAGAHTSEYARAQAFLADRFEAGGGWRADWYDNRLYAAYEIGKALPRHPHTRRFAAALGAQQNSDGGFSPSSAAPSTPAATGCGLALLCEHVEANSPTLLRALDYLVVSATPDGTWPGPTGMYGPRPFVSDYAIQTHALTLLGPACVLRKLTSAGSEDALPTTSGSEPTPQMLEDSG